MFSCGKIETLVVTGGIGSGKSVVTSMFAAKGIPVYDCDSRTKLLYDSDIQLIDAVSEAVGADVRGVDGRLDRKHLGNIIFSDQKKLAALEAVVHPRVLLDFNEWKKKLSVECGFVVMESAIVLEKPLFASVADKILVVDAPISLRLERACKRDNATKGQIEERMRSQRLLNEISNGRIPENVSYVIINDGTLGELSIKVDAFFDRLLHDRKK